MRWGYRAGPELKIAVYGGNFPTQHFRLEARFEEEWKLDALPFKDLTGGWLSYQRLQVK